MNRWMLIPALMLLPLQALAQGAENNALDEEITEASDAAVERGLAALVATQVDNGSFGEGRYANNVAVTSLACLALMSDGNLPGRGAYGENVRKGLEFVLANSSESGLIAGDAANGPMYGHGFATLFLGEVYGMTGGSDTPLADRTYEALVKAIRLIERTQNEEGGWRYNPLPNDADVSVTICQVMAMRSARNAGIEVSKETIDKAVEYVRACQNTDGGFKYQLTTRDSAWPRTAAGVAALQYAGIYTDEALDQGLGYLMETSLPGEGTSRRSPHYFYGQYYAIQAMYLAGDAWWARWWPAAREELVSLQRPDGLWEDRGVGEAYGTAMALIVLQMPKRYLPIFQK